MMDSSGTSSTASVFEDSMCAKRAKEYGNCKPHRIWKQLQCTFLNLVQLATLVCVSPGLFHKGTNAYACLVIIPMFYRSSFLRQKECNATSYSRTGLRSEFRSTLQRTLERCPAADPTKHSLDHITPLQTKHFPMCLDYSYNATGWFLSRTALIFTRALLRLSGVDFNTWSSLRVSWPLPCWETHLLAAEHLYEDKSVAWDIDDGCLDTLERALHSSVGHASESIFIWGIDTERFSKTWVF